VPTVEIVFTRLHAGGKFDKGSGGAYAFSGGLHGVGVSVTNALSKRLEITSGARTDDGNGVHNLVAFADGDVIEPLKSARERGGKKNGTRVTAWPNAQIFRFAEHPEVDLVRLLRSKAVLLPGVTVTLTNAKTGDVQTWRYDEGLRGYLNEMLAQSSSGETVIPAVRRRRLCGRRRELCRRRRRGLGRGLERGRRRGARVLRQPDPDPKRRHARVRPARRPVFGAVKGFVELHGLLPKGVKLLPEDVFARVSFVLSAKVLDPQFQGQTKERLNSRDAVKLVSTFTKPPLELWLNQHVEYGKKLADLVIKQAQSRMRSLQKVEKKKSSGVAVLPGKLTDCESTDLTRNELFLVEGDSAGGSAKMGRDKEYQAILPLRGKVLNTWETDRDRLFANNEIHDIAVAIGVDPHSHGDSPDLTGLRYGKICILSDADVDGSHIQVLLLTLFFKHFPALFSHGHICIARPPLYRVDAPARGKKPIQKLYALDDGELLAIEDKLSKDGLKEGAWNISRFKGLGEMNAEQLWETTMNPDTRRLLPVALGDFDHGESSARFNMLMGKGEAAARRAWIEEHGNETEADI
jgi:topoisomerase-4 subunit B